MKILLIYPYFLEKRSNEGEIAAMPMGVYFVGALLKESGYDVEILNWHDAHKNPGKIENTIVGKNPDIIGFSILNANRWGGIEIARIARKIKPHVKIIFGGPGATFLWEHLLTHFTEIDFIVLGEGEYAFLNLTKCLEREDHEGIANIRGLAFRKNGDVIRTEDAKFISDLDELPNPARYFTYEHVSFSRGCPWHCTFCGSPRFWHRKVRFHSPDYFVQQLELLYKNGVRFLFFSDDTFTLKKEFVIDICKKILERKLNITWVAISRVNYVSKEILYWMRRAGCTQISYGVESGSEKIRYMLKKNISTEQIKKAFSLTTKYGIMARAYFIYGCPGETWGTIQETIELIREIKPLSIIFYILTLFPGTELYSEYKETAEANEDVWLKRIEDIMCWETEPKLSRDQVLAFGEKLRKTYYQELPSFVQSVGLIDKKELYPFHADFLSRLGMTFTHGDYAGIEEIGAKDETGEKLFKRSLSYYPDHRAYLGLGILKQKQGAHRESTGILSEGLEYFPESEPLNTCLGISYMNMGDYEKALPHFLRFQQSENVASYIAACYEALKRGQIFV